WTVMDRLGEINVPTLVMAGRDDFLFPPEHQEALAAGLPNARLKIIERAGHNPQDEQTAEVMEAVRNFLLPATLREPLAESNRYEAIDTYVESERRRLKMPGVSLAIVEGDQIVHLRGFGRARPDGETPTPHTPFYIGSLAKAITATAVMQLVEADKIELEAPVQRYLPWFRVADAEASAQITVRHLLNQTSGLPLLAGEMLLADFDEGPDAAERQARALSTLELTRPVGAAFEYSNMNYVLLGLIVEAASGESYAGYVQEHIFTPLAMNHTYTSSAVAQKNGLAVGHRYWFGIPFAAPNMPIPPAALAGGGLISSAEHMAHFLIAHLNGGRYGDARLLSSAGIDELHRGVAATGATGLGPLENFLAKGMAPSRYAMGWSVDKIGQTQIVWHSGTLPHFGAYMALVPQQKKGIVLLFNACHHWMNPILAETGTGAAALLAGEQPAPMPFVRAMPWMLRAQLLIPVLQVAGVLVTLRRLRRWRLEPERRPSGKPGIAVQVLLPLVANLSLAGTLRPMLGKGRGYLRRYMPDYAWIAMICGGFALVWSVVRTGLVLRALKRPRPEEEPTP
ncbi:MAG TPA: alpha/beta fold hydrolase, partial [Candidatus Sulfomarinibacteraceae bacterium]|nr:alpha/beta fold hydrolase [Candidatus Sulfomarinibacteraceae bacterium]